MSFFCVVKQNSAEHTRHKLRSQEVTLVTSCTIGYPRSDHVAYPTHVID
jgi:hypothetical protein